MNLQVSVPHSTDCVMNCKFCISCTHGKFDGHHLPAILWGQTLRDYVVANNFKSVVITGENEPLQQLSYVTSVLTFLPEDIHIELIIKGYKLDKLMDAYPKLVKRINVVSFSVSNDGSQGESQYYLRQLALAKRLHAVGVRTRMTFMLTQFLSAHQVREASRFEFIDEITLKKLQGGTPWILKNASSRVARDMLADYTNIKIPMKEFNLFPGRWLTFPYEGKEIYIDMSCTSSGYYEIYRPDGNIYDSWDATECIKDLRAGKYGS